MAKKYLGNVRKGEYTQNDVRKTAMTLYWNNIKSMVMYRSCFPPQIFDHRYCFDNDVEREYSEIVHKRNYYADSRMMHDKQSERKENRKGMEFQNILQNPIVIDYLKHHRFHSHVIYHDHISWGVRNHWAKSAKDRVILGIFRKWDRKHKIEDLRNERNDLVEKFQKRIDYAKKSTQDRMDVICNEIDKLMNTDNSIEVSFMQYVNGKKVVKSGRVILSDDEEKNRFFRFCIGFHDMLDEYTPFYHIHDHYPFSPHKIEKSLDIFEGTYRNQFVDDYVYTTANDELAIKYGNLKVDSWFTNYNCVLTTSVHANPFSSSPALISQNHKEVERYEGNRWFDTNRIVGSYQ